jgi:glutathione S-transferase
MYLDSSKSSPVYGESIILRFLSRLLLDQSYEKSLKANQLALADDLIDSCTNEFKNSKEAKLNNSFLKSLNEKLKNSKFFVLDNSVTIADIYIWSILKQKSNCSLNNFKNLSQWLNNIESIDLFQLFQCLN